MYIHTQQNGVVERKHRHLIQVARSLLFQSGLPQKFWGEAILTATFFINKLPSFVLQWKSPYEVLYHKPPDYNSLRIFGCLSYATIVDPHKHKFDERAKKCVLLGYVPHCKGLKLYDIEHKQVVVSRDVVFHEHVFPYKTIQDDVSAPIPLPVFDSDGSASNPVVSDSPDVFTKINSFDSCNEIVSSPVRRSTQSSLADVPVRRSTRVKKQPQWLKNYIVGNASISCIPTVAHPAANISLLANISRVQDPKTYKEACVLPHWVEAMNKEIEALQINQT